MRVLTISGSLRPDSYNALLLHAVEEQAPADLELHPFEGLADIPHFHGDRQDSGPTPEAVQRLRSQNQAADAVLIATPEYNGSIPGVLKNAVDWASRPREDAALRDKTVAVAGASTGQFGALWAQQDLRRVLGVAGARVVCPELPVGRAQDVCDETGGPSPLVAERLRTHITELLREAVPMRVAA